MCPHVEIFLRILRHREMMGRARKVQATGDSFPTARHTFGEVTIGRLKIVRVRQFRVRHGESRLRQNNCVGTSRRFHGIRFIFMGETFSM